MRPSNDHILQREPKMYSIIDIEMGEYAGDWRGRVEKDFPYESFNKRKVEDGRMLV